MSPYVIVNLFLHLTEINVQKGKKKKKSPICYSEFLSEAVLPSPETFLIYFSCLLTGELISQVNVVWIIFQ